MSLVSIDKTKIQISFIRSWVSIILTAGLFTYSIYSEIRFYEKYLYLLDLSMPRSYFIIFFILVSVLKLLSEIYVDRFYNLTKYFPFMFLFTGVYSGTNFHIYSLIFVYFGFISLFYEKYSKKFFGVYSLVSFTWIVNSAGESYYFKPDKLRGFTSTSYSIDAVIFYSLFFYLFILGCKYVFKESLYRVNIFEYFSSYKYIIFSVLALGYIGSANPIVNFFNYYYFGQQKYGTTNSSPFELNEWLERISWRGFYFISRINR